MKTSFNDWRYPQDSIVYFEVFFTMDIVFLSDLKIMLEKFKFNLHFFVFNNFLNNN